MLRAFFREHARERERGILLDHLEPDAPLDLRLMNQRDAMPALRFERGDQLGRIGVEVDDQRLRDELVEVMLADEGFEHGRLDRLLRKPARRFDVRWKVGTVSEVAPAADHREVHACAPALDPHRDHIDVGVGPLAVAQFDVLLTQHARERADLVAHRRGLFEAQAGGGGLHLGVERREHFGRLPAKKSRCVLDIERIRLGRDRSHARRAAAPDLMQQAGPRTMGEDRVLASAQHEDLLQDLDALLDRPGIGKRPEVFVPLVDRAAVVRHARVAMRGDLQVGIGLVVAKDDVVARRLRLDEVVLEQQRFSLGPGGRGLDLRDALDHVRDARIVRALVEVAGDALLQVARLAHIEQHARRVVVAIDAGQARQLRDDAFGIEGRLMRRRLRFSHRGSRCERISASTASNMAGVRRRVCVL